MESARIELASNTGHMWLYVLSKPIASLAVCGLLDLKPASTTAPTHNALQKHTSRWKECAGTTYASAPTSLVLRGAGRSCTYGVSLTVTDLQSAAFATRLTYAYKSRG